MADFKAFWAATRADPASPLLAASEPQIRAAVACPRCVVCLDFFLANVNFMDSSRKGGKEGPPADVIRVYRKGGHYSIKEGEIFALVQRPYASPALSIPPASADSDAPMFQISPPILFNSEDLLRLERDGTLGPAWESGPLAGNGLTASSSGGGSASAKKSKKKKEPASSTSSESAPALSSSPAPSASLSDALAGTGCSYCSSMLELRFVNMVTYPRPPDMFTLLLNKTESLGTVRAIMHRIVLDRVKSSADLILSSRGKTLSDDSKSLCDLALKDRQMVVVSESSQSAAAAAAATPSFFSSPTSSTILSNSSASASYQMSLMSELGELLFGTGYSGGKRATSGKKRPALVEELFWARGVEIATRAAARVVRGKIEAAWAKERAARINEQLLMEELLAEESKKEQAEKKKLKAKEKREQQRKEQQEQEEALMREKELQRQKEEAEEKVRLEKERQREKEIAAEQAKAAKVAAAASAATAAAAVLAQSSSYAPAAAQQPTGSAKKKPQQSLQTTPSKDTKDSESSSKDAKSEAVGKPAPQTPVAVPATPPPSQPQQPPSEVTKSSKKKKDNSKELQNQAIPGYATVNKTAAPSSGAASVAATGPSAPVVALTPAAAAQPVEPVKPVVVAESPARKPLPSMQQHTAPPASLLQTLVSPGPMPPPMSRAPLPKPSVQPLLPPTPVRTGTTNASPGMQKLAQYGVALEEELGVTPSASSAMFTMPLAPMVPSPMPPPPSVANPMMVPPPPPPIIPSTVRAPPGIGPLPPRPPAQTLPPVQSPLPALLSMSSLPPIGGGPVSSPPPSMGAMPPLSSMPPPRMVSSVSSSVPMPLPSLAAQGNSLSTMHPSSSTLPPLFARTTDPIFASVPPSPPPAAVAKESVITCSACGTVVPSGGRFCSRCGTAVILTAPAAASMSGGSRLSFFANLRG